MTETTDGAARRGRLAAKVDRAVDRVAAPVLGSLEGAAESAERYDLRASTHDAIGHGARLARAVRPVRPSAPGARGASKRRRASSRSKPARRLHAAADAAFDTLHSASAGAAALVAGTKEKVDAVAESAQRATEAPPVLARDVRQAFTAWVGGLAAGVGLMAGGAFLGVLFVAVFTVGLVVGLDMLLGAPWGAFAVAGAYLAGAVACFLAANAKRRRAQREAAQHIAHAKGEVRRVTRPIRRAFSANR
ncbi:MAG: phage holin family protein [Thermoplasmatota archaeon]